MSPMRYPRVYLTCLLGLTLLGAGMGMLPTVWAEEEDVEEQAFSLLYTASNPPVYRPVKVPVTSVAPAQPATTGLQTVYATPRPHITQFPEHKQLETHLTQFIMDYNKRLNWEQAHLIAESVVAFSKHYKVDYRLMLGVIAVESSFRTDAISTSGAIGLGQLKPATAQWLGVVNPFDPIDNIAGMTRYLSYLITKYDGSLDHALSAYFQGPGTIDREGISDVAKNYLHRVNAVLSKM